jgi:hypothetical protein
VDRKNTEPASDGDQRRLRPEYHSEAQRRERGGDDPEQVDGCNRTASLETFRRFVTADARQISDGCGYENSAERQPGQRPPHRLSVEAEVSGQMREDLTLDLGDALQEEVRHRRDGDSDEASERDKYQIAPRPDDGGGVRGSRW